MRTLAIDLGTRRVGLALSDESGRLATPHSVLQISSPDLAIDPILQLIEREGVRRVVVGLPLNMDGTIGPQARETIDWAAGLRKTVTVPILLVDERLSSFDAEQRVVDRKRHGERISRKAKRTQLDALAAASFLQAFLDGQLPPLEIPIP